MLDAHQHAPAQAPPPYAPRRGAGGGSGGFIVPRTPRVIAAAFAVAVALGVVIGLVTAPHGSKAKPATVAQTAVDPRAAPAIPEAVWGGVRQAGSTRQMVVPTSNANREALRYVYATKVGQPVDAVTIPSGKLYYGVVQGNSVANDTYYAAGLVDAGGPTTLVVWERNGNGPWRVSQEGPGSCDILPSTLFSATVWKGKPGLCAGA